MILYVTKIEPELLSCNEVYIQYTRQVSFPEIRDFSKVKCRNASGEPE